MSTLKQVFDAKKEFINDDAELEITKLNGGYSLSLWHDREKFNFIFTPKNRKEFYTLIIALFNQFDFSFFLDGTIEDLKDMFPSKG